MHILGSLPKILLTTNTFLNLSTCTQIPERQWLSLKVAITHTKSFFFDQLVMLFGASSHQLTYNGPQSVSPVLQPSLKTFTPDIWRKWPVINRPMVRWNGYTGNFSPGFAIMWPNITPFGTPFFESLTYAYNAQVLCSKRVTVFRLVFSRPPSGQALLHPA